VVGGVEGGGARTIGEPLPGGVSESIGAAAGGFEPGNDETGPKTEDCSSPPMAEGAIRLGNPSTVG